MDVLYFVARTLANVTSTIFCRCPHAATGPSHAHNHNAGARKKTNVEHDERVINASNDETSTLN